MYHFDWLKRHAERTPDKLALVDAHTGREFTYGLFDERAINIALERLSRFGVNTEATVH